MKYYRDMCKKTPIETKIMTNWITGRNPTKDELTANTYKHEDLGTSYTAWEGYFLVSLRNGKYENRHAVCYYQIPEIPTCSEATPEWYVAGERVTEDVVAWALFDKFQEKIEDKK
jgi:hypothetical protein